MNRNCEIQPVLPLFAAKSHRTDPVTSHIAAEMHEKGGRAATHRQICLEAVNTTPGLTSAEIASKTGLERHEAARRLSDLYNAGLLDRKKPRKCTVNHTSAMCWWPL